MAASEPPLPPLSIQDPELPFTFLTPYLHLVTARERQRAGDTEGARVELARAREQSPGLIEPILAASWLDLRRSPDAATADLLAALEVARARFSWQAPTLIGMAWGLIATFLVTLSLLTAVYATQAAGPLHHLLTEQLAKTVDSRIAAAAAALLLCLPLIWGAGILASGLILLLLAAPGLANRQRILVGTGCLLMVALGLAPRFAPGLVRPPDFSDRAQILDLAGHAPLTPALSARLTAMSAEGIDLALLVHGNALRRAGENRIAESVLASFAEARPRDPRGQLALGNCRFTAGDPEGAIAYYRRATALDPTVAAPFVNLAVAYSVLLQFEMANAALADAARIDPAAVAALGTLGAQESATSGTTAMAGAASFTPTEIGIRPGELWELFRRERSDRGVDLPGYLTAWLPWSGRSAWPLALVLLVAAGLLGRPLAKSLSTFQCSGCGRAICRRCVTRRRGLALCRRCHKRFGDLPAHDAVGLWIAAETRANRGRGWRLAWNVVLPGYGIIKGGRHVLGAIMVGALAAAWVGFQTGGHPIMPLPAVPVIGPLFGGGQAPGLALLLIYALTVMVGFETRPSLGTKKSGRIAPLAAASYAPAGRIEPYRGRTGTIG
jgi:tetratricopeptide (TPR) repeat protein